VIRLPATLAIGGGRVVRVLAARWR
jgi:hypothetical protein